MARVLVVDDDAGIRDAVHFALECAAHTVAEASNGVVAPRLPRAAAHPLVVLLDNLMTGPTELDLLHMATREAVLSRHAYVVFTASPGRIRADLAALAGQLSVPLLTTPFDLDVPLAIVDEAAWRLPDCARSVAGRHHLAAVGLCR